MSNPHFRKVTMSGFAERILSSEPLEFRLVCKATEPDALAGFTADVYMGEDVVFQLVGTREIFTELVAFAAYATQQFANRLASALDPIRLS